MGVSGSGKSAVGRKLADRLGATYIEGDDYHSTQSIAKMTQGVPLNDEDRQDWLLALQSLIAQAVQRHESIVLTCSALKRRYRDILRVGDPELVFIYLHGEYELIANRMKSRTGHFMPGILLDTQLRDLEPPGADERSIRVDITPAPDEIVDAVIAQIDTV